MAKFGDATVYETLTAAEVAPADTLGIWDASVSRFKLITAAALLGGAAGAADYNYPLGADPDLDLTLTPYEGVTAFDGHPGRGFAMWKDEAQTDWRILYLTNDDYTLATPVLPGHFIPAGGLGEDGFFYIRANFMVLRSTNNARLVSDAGPLDIGPHIVMSREVTNPPPSSLLGGFHVGGCDSVSATVNVYYAAFVGEVISATPALPQGRALIATADDPTVNAGLTPRVAIGLGIAGCSALGAPLTDPGVGKANFTEYQISGTNLFATANIFTATQTFRLSDDSSTVGPFLVLDRLSTSPNVGDVLAELYWQGRDASGNLHNYASIHTLVINATHTTEAAQLRMRTSIAGSVANRGAWGAGLIVGDPDAVADPGAGFVAMTGFVTTGTSTFRFTDDGASTGATIYERISTSPAANDEMWELQFFGKDSAGNTIQYTGLRNYIIDPTNGSEDGSMVIKTRVADSLGGRVFIHAGLSVGSATDPGSGNINAQTSLFVAGSKVVGAQGASIADPTGGGTVDTEARTAVIAVISRLEAHGLIATV